MARASHLRGVAALGLLLMGDPGHAATCPPQPSGERTLATDLHEAVVSPLNQPTGASRALELMLCTVEGSADDPFLVQVLARSASGDTKKPDVALGVVSFLPVKTGVAQRFVVPFSKAESDRGDYDVVIRLIPPTADRTVAKSAVAVLGAKFGE